MALKWVLKRRRARNIIRRIWERALGRLSLPPFPSFRQRLKLNKFSALEVIKSAHLPHNNRSISLALRRERERKNGIWNLNLLDGWSPFSLSSPLHCLPGWAKSTRFLFFPLLLLGNMGNRLKNMSDSLSQWCYPRISAYKFHRFDFSFVIRI